LLVALSCYSPGYRKFMLFWYWSKHYGWRSLK